MNKLILGTIITFLTIFAGNGGYAGGYLRIGMGPTGQALGNSGTAYMEPVPSSIYYNPALLTKFADRSFELGLSSMSLDRHFHYLAYATPLKGTAAIGAYYIKSGVDNITGRDNTGQKTGEIEIILKGATVLTLGHPCPCKRQIHPEYKQCYCSR